MPATCAILIVLIAAFTVPPCLYAQSLAGVAGAEAARRAATEKPSKVISNDDLLNSDGTRANADLPPDPTGAGKWTVRTEKNPLNDRAIVTALLSAEGPIKGWLATATPTLVVRCQTPVSPERLPAILPVQPGLEVYLVTGMPAAVENGEGIHQLRVRFDDGETHMWGSSESTDKKALFVAPIYATEMVVTKRTLATSRQMLVGFTPFNASPVIMKFDVRGFRTHMNDVLQACPPVDRSAWR